MPYFEVPGASLHYETVGNGPVLLCITGAGGAEFWRAFAEHLKDQFTVVTYDRRGYSKSHLSDSEPQDYDHRLDTDADDAAALLKHVSPNEPGSVLGNSTGAIVALQTLIRHPDSVLKVLAHEPPAHRYLPEFEYIVAGSKELYQLYRRHGIPPALQAFSQAVKLNEVETAELMKVYNSRSNPYSFLNCMYWMEREVPYYPSTEFDLEALVKAKSQLVLANGADTDREAGHYGPNLVLAEKLGMEVTMLPGAHLGAVTHAEAHAKAVERILKGK